jgi:SAM-dependent methyltransferase
VEQKPFDNATHDRGLLAEWYDEVLVDEESDIGLYRGIVADSNGPVLELACGTGRLLVPFRAAGADIDGLDASADMLAICRRKLERLGLSATLYEQRMEALRPARSYGLIFCSGTSFQLVDSLAGAEAALRAVHEALLPGAELVMDLCMPWQQMRADRDGVWRQGRTAERDDGTRFGAHHCDVFDFERQVIRGTVRYELYQGGWLTESWTDSINLKWYGTDEFRMLLERTGFEGIRLERRGIISTHDDTVVYRAGRR